MRPRPILQMLLFGCGWVGVAYAQSPIELEVLGQITVHAEVEPTGEGQQLVRGRLSDEVGKPVGGSLSVRDSGGRLLAISPCPGMDTPDVTAAQQPVPTPGAFDVAPSGEFCFTSEAAKGLVLKATGDHFVAASHDLDTGAERALMRPRFVRAPQTVDRHEDSSLIVEILVRGEQTPPEQAELTFALECESSHLIERVTLDDARLLRFEFTLPKDVIPGTCQFVGTVDAPDHKPLRATRSVLLRDLIRLVVDEQSEADGVAILKINALSSADQPSALNEGIVEARENGAFLALSPIRRGQAVVELETTQFEREITLTYIPASSAFVPGDPARAVIPARAQGFRWASIHTLGLLLFVFWLGYAWLKPGRQNPALSESVPPKQAVLRASGKKTGPVFGQVLDAHTGLHLKNVQLVLQVVTAEMKKDLETVLTGEHGEFRFETRLESHPVVKLQASAAEHMTLHSTVHSAQVSVHLTHRRRAVLTQLIGWAKTAGHPWYKKKVPTPGSIETTAQIRREADTAQWARQVAEAAYAPMAPSENQVEGLRGPANESRPKPS